MDGGFGGGARIGRAGRKSLDSQLVAREIMDQRDSLQLSPRIISQETPGLTDGLEFVRVIPTDWPAACPDRHREAIHHLILFSFSLDCYLSQGGSLYWCYSTATTTATTTPNLQNIYPSIHPSITEKKKKKKKKKILRFSPTRTLPCAIHPNPHNTKTL